MQNKLVMTINPFSHPWSYAREGFISLSLKNDYKTDDRLRLAHEIAHLWWSNNEVYGSGNDWLEEGFAEYSSLVWYESFAGEKDFAEFLKKYKEASKLETKLSEVKPKKAEFVPVIYFKGAYLLYYLNKKMSIILREISKKNR